MYIFSVIKNILAILDGPTKKRYFLLQFIFFIAAIFQVIGIASIGPFISILSNPNIIHENDILSYLYLWLGFKTNIQFIIVSAFASLILILLSNLVAGMTVWLSYRFSVVLGSKLQKKAFKSYLYKDYLFHKTENYNDKIALVTQQIPRFVYMLFQPFLLFTSQLFVALLILTGLLFLNPSLALIAGLIIGGSYLFTYIYLRKKLSKHGSIITERSEKIQSILSEAFIGIKDVKLDSLEPRYVQQFNLVNIKGLNSQAFISLSGELPKFIIESISFGAILILAVVLLLTVENPNSVVPILSIYALAGYKLLPTMQQIYKSVSSLSGHGSVAALIKNKLNQPIEFPSEDASLLKPMPVKRVKLNEATFSYDKNSRPAVNNVSLDLEQGSVYSLVGHSGSGKSTLADIILGLLKLNSGELEVNGKIMTSKLLPAFRKQLGYVAQNIFILEDTVTRNVAFGSPDTEIDIDRVTKALRMANALDFVLDLPDGLDSNLGQDGKLLSGGQRQRIGIARALYKNTSLLVLDEPTSALDIESEFKLMETLNSLKSDLIILLISHRPASIRMSDQIVLMTGGTISGIGTYEELFEKNIGFKRMMETEVS
ncbi:multidrug ABC transporter ATPase [Marinobacter sp. CP1]|jgi:ABC-type multidrug transport system fused ATPase/permease subunit|uniref:ABC transporter ATP-binding protein n=1 Tax=unclassified Marinobacter TaxID=83889 RepID=UPI00069F4D08|nr:MULTISPECIES: ABC transporter ATP-binding protein [unclassified Marinobacter]AKV98554.1 multidrug ABC transporter ATPase [Marinobacter sp. CP1]